MHKKPEQEAHLESVSCYNCNHLWSFEAPMGRRDECPSCQRDSRVCMNCCFFDRGAHRQCREPQAELVAEKEQGNFCGYFRAASRGAAGKTAGEADTRKKLANLFGGGEADDSPPGIRSLEDLFKK